MTLLNYYCHYFDSFLFVLGQQPAGLLLTLYSGVPEYSDQNTKCDAREHKHFTYCTNFPASIILILIFPASLLIIALQYLWPIHIPSFDTWICNLVAHIHSGCDAYSFTMFALIKHGAHTFFSCVT